MNSRQLVGSSELLARTYRVFTSNLVVNILFGLFIALPFAIFSWLSQPYMKIPNIFGQPYFVNLPVDLIIIIGFISAIVISSFATITLISYTHKIVSGQTESLFVAFGRSFDNLFAWL